MKRQDAQTQANNALRNRLRREFFAQHPALGPGFRDLIDQVIADAIAATRAEMSE